MALARSRVSLTLEALQAFFSLSGWLVEVPMFRTQVA